MNYRPTRTSPEQWDTIRSFVVDCIFDMRPRTPRTAQHAMSVLTHYVLWAVFDLHASLDRDDIFHTTMIRRYINTIARTQHSKQTYEHRLYSIAVALSGQPDTIRPPSSRQLQPVHVYTPRELADLDSWASVRRTEAKRRAARLLIGLVGGAGARRGELPTIRRAHVHRTTNDRITIDIGGRLPRTVTVHPDWAWYFDALIYEPADDQKVIFDHLKSHGAYTNAVNHLFNGPHPYPSSTRLRDTFVVNTLNTLPAADAVYQIGLTTATSITRYMPYLTPGANNS